MAMSSGTMSNNPNEWLQFYTQNLTSSTTPMFGHDQLSAEATVVTTTATSSAAQQGGLSHPSSSTNNSLSPDQGRVSKPVRKRSRASRRTPTTLLNTDTTNFRAMVQQFTGGPNTASFPTGVTNFSFGLGQPRPQGFAVPTGYHPLQPQQQQQLQQQQLQQHHHYQQQRQNQQYLLSLNNNSAGGVGGDGFLERLSTSSRVGPTNMGLRVSSDHIDHEFLREGVSSQVPSASRHHSDSSNENRSNNFMF